MEAGPDTPKTPEAKRGLPLSRAQFAALAIALGAVIFIALNLFANRTFTTARLDLTENSLYTLSKGARETLRSIDEPITLTFFYSQRLGTGFPQIHAYASRVQDLLREFAGYADGRLRIETVEPEPFSEAEDLAVALGLQGAATAEGETLYFGLSGTNAVDGRETVPFFAQAREPFLEYDLTKLISRLNAKTKPKLALLTSLPMEGGRPTPAAPQGGGPLLLYQELEDRFEIEHLDEAFSALPGDVSVLLIVHPKPLTQPQAYAIDQFVLRGGRVLAFIDPFSEFSITGGQFGQPSEEIPLASDLGPLLAAWGVELEDGEVIGDLDLAQEVAVGADPRRPISAYVIWLKLSPDHLDTDDIVTGELELLNIATAGHLEPLEDAGTEIQPLMRSSRASTLMDAAPLKFSPLPDQLLADFEADDETYNLAVRISGTFATAFPDGPPAGVAAGAEQLKTSAESGNVIVVADADLFDDRFWVNEQNFLGQAVAVPTADNANFVIGAVENLMGSNALISLRTRTGSQRPFTLVERLRRKAEARFLAEEQALQSRIRETERRLQDLQGQAGADAQNVFTLTAEQEAEVARFRRELVNSRGELRKVQRSLRSEIEALGNRIKFLNIAVMPLLVALAAMGLAVWRARARARRAGAAG